MQPNLNCYQHKIDQHNYKMFYISLIATTKQNPTEVTQTTRMKSPKHVTRENHQIPELTGEEERNKEFQKISRKEHSTVNPDLLYISEMC